MQKLTTILSLKIFCHLFFFQKLHCLLVSVILVRSTLIDNIFSNVIEPNTKSGILTGHISDHQTIFISINFKFNTDTKTKGGGGLGASSRRTHLGRKAPRYKKGSRVPIQKQCNTKDPTWKEKAPQQEKNVAKRPHM